MIAPPLSRAHSFSYRVPRSENKFAAIVDDDDSMRGALQGLLEGGWILIAGVQLTSPQRQRLTIWHHRGRSCIQSPSQQDAITVEKFAQMENIGFLRSRVGNCCVCVGLENKASLYQSVPVQSQHMLAAKLLSDRERPADTVIQIKRATAPSLTIVCVALTLFATLFLDPKRQSRWILQRAQNPQRRPIPAATPQRSLRPPPSRR